MALWKRIVARWKNRGKSALVPIPPAPETVAADRPSPYHVYTTAFDQVLESKDLFKVLGPMTSVDDSALKDAWGAFEGALNGWRTRCTLSAFEMTASLRAGISEDTFKDTVVTLMVDQSGSMKGRKILMAAAAVDVAQDFLRGLGCAVEVLGFTTVSWKGGLSRRRWISAGRPAYPGRLCDLLHIVYRSADDERSSSLGNGLKNMLRPDLLKENVDGEALEWAAMRLRTRPEKRKILVVISDGAPVDDATLAANGGRFLHEHLTQVIASLETSSDILLAAVGIGHDTRAYYRIASCLEIPEDLGQEIIALLGRLLREAKMPPILH